jgi:penicillin-binding protein 2
MRHLTAVFAVGFALVLVRIVALEIWQGAAFRQAAARPLAKSRPLPGIRGQIISRDGRVLACDQRMASLAVHYRYLEDPPSPRWLRAQARARVPSSAPDRAARVADEARWLAAHRADLLEQLAQLCGRPLDELESLSRDVQRRVRAISATVNDARRHPAADPPARLLGGISAARALVNLAPPWLFAPADERPPARVVVAEELDYHVVARDVPLEVVAEIESRPEHYPGVRIIEQSCRRYPCGTLVAGVLGHLGTPDLDRDNRPGDGRGEAAHELVGRAGAERQFEIALRGRDGLLVDFMDHSGRLLKSERRLEPASGADVTLTLHAALQQIAEERLDRTLARLARAAGAARPMGGGAVVVLDVHNGAILAAATAPRFDPNIFSAHDGAAIERVLADRAHPLFDRATKMAIPPGSVFKTVTALALLADREFDPQSTFDCQGYLALPDRQRCQIFRRYGVGHGAVNLSDAVTQSCNVYFFHHAEQLGPSRLADWGARLGFGQATGVDLPGEAAGFLPGPANPGTPGREWKLADAQALAIGQSTLTATPLQVARLMAAVANGGYLVTPHVAAGARSSDESAAGDSSEFDAFTAPRRPVPGLGQGALDVVRQSLARVADDPQGTAYAALSDAGIAIAGKTGTAETGERTADHAWFAGYAPADAPRVAFAIALEHQGSADHAATLAKEIVQALAALGMLERADAPEFAADSQ